jgi:hypothetical protein
LVEDVLNEKYKNDSQTSAKLMAKLKNSGIIEEIYDPELLTDRQKLEKKLEPYFLQTPKNRTIFPAESTEPIKLHKIIIKDETTKGFDVCALFTIQFFIGIVIGFVLAAPVTIGIVLYLKRGKTYNYAINRTRSQPPT